MLSGLHLWADLDRDRRVGGSRPNRDVNKAGSFKAKAKSLKAKGKAKAKSLKAKSKARSLKAKARDQG